MPRGRFIVFEGVDGSGKTTAMATIARQLRAAGLDILTTREPGGTDFGAAVRAIIFAHAETIGAEAELLLMCADRAEHVRSVIEPALDRGLSVLCDRYAASTIAYQGYGRDVDLDTIEFLTALATQGLQPDVTLLFDIEVDVAAARRAGDAESMNSLDVRDHDFRERVRSGYLALAATRPGWVTIDASQPSEAVANAAAAAVREVLGR